MTQSLNQFAPTALKGDLVYAPNRPNLAVRVDANQATALVPAQVVKLVDTTADMPVVAAAAVTDIPYGVVVRNTRVTSFAAKSVCTIARDGDVVWMEAAGAIAAGAKLEFTTSATVDDTTTQGQKLIGKALTKAAGSGDLIQVEICCLASMQ